jgi:hypothetical protein
MKYFGCECKHEVMGIEKIDDQVWILFYEIPGGTMPFKDRLKAAWKMLTKGTPFPNEIVLSVDDANGLSDELRVLVRQIVHEKQEIAFKKTQRASSKEPGQIRLPDPPVSP